MATPLTTAYEHWLARRVPQAALREAALFGSSDLMVTVAATLATLLILAYQVLLLFPNHRLRLDDRNRYRQHTKVGRQDADIRRTDALVDEVICRIAVPS
jgi:hypothetical protein